MRKRTGVKSFSFIREFYLSKPNELIFKKGTLKNYWNVENERKVVNCKRN